MYTQSVVLGEHDSAVRLLLQTGASSPNAYADALRACLIAALKTPDRIESTIKVGLLGVGDPFAGNNCQGVEEQCSLQSNVCPVVYMVQS